MARKKDLSIETLRGFAILLVVVFHVIGDDPATGIGITDDASWYRYFQFSSRYLRMPLFTVISGFVYAMRPVVPGKVATFLRGKARRILLPLVSVSTLQFLAKLAAPGVNRSVELAGMWRIYIYPFDQFWFLQAVFLIFLTVALLDCLGLQQSIRRWLACLSGAAIACVLVPWLASSFGLESWLKLFSLEGYLRLLPFFILGCGLCRFGRAIGPWPVVLAAVACFASGMAAKQVAWFSGIDRRILGLDPAYLIWIGLPGTFLLVHFRTTIRPLAWIGAWAYTIYLFHAFAIGGARVIFGQAALSNHEVQFVLRLLAGLALPIVFDVILSRNQLLRWLFLGLKKGSSQPAIAEPAFRPAIVQPSVEPQRSG